MCMVCSALGESWDKNPNDWIVTRTRLTISPPEEYSGGSNLEVYEMFITGILQWLRLHSLLKANYTKTQVQFLGTWLKGNASNWFTRTIECPWTVVSNDQKEWSSKCPMVKFAINNNIKANSSLTMDICHDQGKIYQQTPLSRVSNSLQSKLYGIY